MTMDWVTLTIVIAAAGALAVRRAVRGMRHRPGMIAAHPPARRAEQPHRHIAHYRASGALPRWDP
jgi:hypothetical protein